MTDQEKTFSYGELILNELREMKSEIRELRRELTQRMDRIEARQDKLDTKIDETRKELTQRMDKLDTKFDETRKELKTAVDDSQKEIHSSARHGQILTATVVSIVVVVIYSVLSH